MKKIMVLFDFPEGTLQEYDKVWEDLKAAGFANPNGLLYHVGAEKQGGGIIVVDVWETEERFNEFGKTLMPIIAKSGIKGQPKIMPVHNIYER